jgi:hypothetical protein
MYTTEKGVMVGPLLYADDNLMPPSLANTAKLQPTLAMYEDYTGISGFKHPC